MTRTFYSCKKKARASRVGETPTCQIRSDTTRRRCYIHVFELSDICSSLISYAITILFQQEESGTTKHVSGRSPKWNIILFLKHECQLQPQYRSSFMLVSNQICRPFGRDVLRCLACTTFMLGAVPYVETSVSELSRASAISDFPSELDYELDARAAYRLQARPPVNNILQICIIN